MSNDLRKTAKELSKTMQCNCDLDAWEPELDTGHSWVCRIHRKAKGLAEMPQYSRKDCTPIPYGEAD